MATTRTVIVTGANTGIGFESCRLFCQDGYDVILACRNDKAAEEASTKLKSEFPQCSVTYMNLDLSSLESVRKFAEDFLKTEKNLSVLVNNAGVFFQDQTRRVSEDGFELTMATNHLGHFLLTSLLLDNLKHSASVVGEARIVVVASQIHDVNVAKKTQRGKPVALLDLTDLSLEKEGSYTATQAYKNSKLANVLFTKELSRRLQGSGVTVNAMCPGFIPQTDLVRHASKAMKCFVACCLDGCLRHCTKFIRRPGEGAHDIYHLSTDESFKGVSGKYYSSGVETEPSSEALEVETQGALWDASETLVSFRVT